MSRPITDYKSALAQLLSAFGRVAKRGVDRRANYGQVAVDHETGLPVSGNNLLGRAEATRGVDLALGFVLNTEAYASGLVWRTKDDGERVLLFAIPKDQWTEDELDLVAHYTSQLSMAAARARDEEGWFRFDTISEVLREDGDFVAQPAAGELPRNVSITWKGLQAALEFLRQNPTWDVQQPLSHGLGRQAQKKAEALRGERTV